MTFPKQVWDQLKAKKCEDLISALQKDGFLFDGKRGATQGYRHPDGRHAVIHYQPNKSYGPKMLKDLLKDIGWSVSDMCRLKLIK